jgi:hypothetical protein
LNAITVASAFPHADEDQFLDVMTNDTGAMLVDFASANS